MAPTRAAFLPSNKKKVDEVGVVGEFRSVQPTQGSHSTTASGNTIRNAPQYQEKCFFGTSTETRTKNCCLNVGIFVDKSITCGEKMIIEKACNDGSSASGKRNRRLTSCISQNKRNNCTWNAQVRTCVA